MTKEVYEFKRGDKINADARVTLPSNFFATVDELSEDIDNLDEELRKVVTSELERAGSSLEIAERYIVTKNIKITYEY